MGDNSEMCGISNNTAGSSAKGPDIKDMVFTVITKDGSGGHIKINVPAKGWRHDSEICGAFNKTAESSAKRSDISDLMIDVLVKDKENGGHKLRSVPASMWSRE